MFEVKHKVVAHMIAQTRAKQLATKDTQDIIVNSIIEMREEYPDISDKELVHRLSQNIIKDYQISIKTYAYLQAQDLNTVGYPIKSSKTHLQLSMAKDWIEEQDENLITQVVKGKFYHNLSNTILTDSLPMLQSPSNSNYWGNENPSVSSVLLWEILNCLRVDPTHSTGAATFFLFLDKTYKLPDDMLYNFAMSHGMTLFGDYQYGAHRNFKEQLIFGPEDCSSAVGKATYLTTNQIKNISTSSIQQAYSNPDNEYKYKAVTLLSGDIQENQLRLIKEGDIYLVKGHTAIVATKPDNKSEVTTIQFNRNIDSLENKILGGGTYDYNLCDKAHTVENGIYILRPNVESLHESYSLTELLHHIDEKYSTIFPDGAEDITGDCRIFFDDI